MWKLAQTKQELEKLIEQYKSSIVDGMPISALADPEVCGGECHFMAQDFADFLKSHGFNAYPSTNHIEQFYGEIPTKEDFHPEDYERLNHSVTTVETEEGNFTVDWTASQYGLKDFPLIKKVSRWSMSYPTNFEKYYHVAPTNYRKNILQFGLDGRLRNEPGYEQGMSGAYVFGNFEEAEWYADYMGRTYGEELDIWEVHPQGLEFQKDHGLSSAESGEEDSAYYSKNPIPASNLRLVVAGNISEEEDEEEDFWREGKISMALRPEQVEEFKKYIGDDHLYHNTHPQNIISILRNGIQTTSPRSKWYETPLRPREDHAYIGTNDLTKGFSNKGAPFIAIPIHKLDPGRINSDPEMQYWVEKEIIDNETGEEEYMPGWEYAEKTFEGHPAMGSEVTEAPSRWRAADPLEPGQKHMDQWAKENPWMDDPDILHHFITTPDLHWHGEDEEPQIALAYRGGVEPENLTLNPEMFPLMLESMLMHDTFGVVPQPDVGHGMEGELKPEDWDGVYDEFINYLNELGIPGDEKDQILEYARQIGADLPIVSYLIDNYLEKNDEDEDSHLSHLKWSMPYPTEDWQRKWTEDSDNIPEKYRYLYHQPAWHGDFNQRLEAVKNILEQGLLPREDNQENKWPAHLRSRPEHVYLGDSNYYDTRHSRGIPAIRINPMNLNPRHVNPDEDFFHTQDGAKLLQGFDPDTYEEFGEPIPTYDEELENWEPEYYDNEEETENQDYTFGDWAEQYGYELDQYAPHSLSTNNSIAYRGHIPPEHIELNPAWVYEALGTTDLKGNPIAPQWLWDHAKKYFPDEYQDALDLLEEEKQRERKVAGRRNDGVIISVEPREKQELAVEGGENPNILHCTMIYFKGGADEWNEDKQKDIEEILKEFASKQNPLEGTISGMSEFPSSDGDPAQVALVSAVGLSEMRTMLKKTLERHGFEIDEKYDFLPHITLAYQKEPIEKPDITIHFDELTLRVADDPYVFSFGKKKTAMAERSGDPEIDAAIEEYMNQNECRLPEGFHTWKEPAEAKGMCSVSAEDFAAWLRNRGINAASLNDPELQDYFESGIFSEAAFSGHYTEWGYADIDDSGGVEFPHHDATLIDYNGQTYMVDWTAAQYGYTEFPMVQKFEGVRQEGATNNTTWNWNRNFLSKKRIAQFNPLPDTLKKTAAWRDIIQKAKRLKDAGQAKVEHNMSNYVDGTVQGDNGTYHTEIYRDDPQSGAITGWRCECPWFQYAFGRTRRWKKYEGRPCAHVMALYWQSLSTPLNDTQPEPEPTPPPTPPNYQVNPEPMPSQFPENPQPGAYPLGDPNIQRVTRTIKDALSYVRGNNNNTDRSGTDPNYGDWRVVSGPIQPSKKGKRSN